MQALNATWVDFLVLGIVVVSTILAVIRGFVRETLSILAWAAAAFATLYFGPAAAALLRARIATPLAGTLIAYAGIFLLVLIPLSFVSYRLSEGVRKSPVGALDRCLGFPFGILRGLALVAVAYLGFSLLVPVRAQPAWMTGARLLPLVQGSSDVLLSLVPNRGGTALADTAEAQLSDVPVPRPSPRDGHAAHRSQKTYGMDDRRALDRLIEATGTPGNPKP
jgi:membrane protein required for colicin V production